MTPAAFAPCAAPLPSRARSSSLAHARHRCAPRTPRRAAITLDATPHPPAPAPAPAAAPQSGAPVPPVAVPAPRPPRTATVTRTTRETDVAVTLNLDGTGECDVDTGVPFLDHMLHQLSSHGLLDLCIRAKGDVWIDDHHTNEDVGITLGLALASAAGDKRGIARFGHFVAPLDEALVEVVLDFSGRGHCEYSLQIPTQRVGTYDTQLVREFYHAVATNAQLTIHVIPRAGLNSHHIIEASFKAFARALRMALTLDPRRPHAVPSSKGTLSDADAVRPAQ